MPENLGNPLESYVEPVFDEDAYRSGTCLAET